MGACSRGGARGTCVRGLARLDGHRAGRSRTTARRRCGSDGARRRARSARRPTRSTAPPARTRGPREATGRPGECRSAHRAVKTPRREHAPDGAPRGLSPRMAHLIARVAQAWADWRHPSTRSHLLKFLGVRRPAEVKRHDRTLPRYHQADVYRALEALRVSRGLAIETIGLDGLTNRTGHVVDRPGLGWLIGAEAPPEFGSIGSTKLPVGPGKWERFPTNALFLIRAGERRLVLRPAGCARWGWPRGRGPRPGHRSRRRTAGLRTCPALRRPPPPAQRAGCGPAPHTAAAVPRNKTSACALRHRPNSSRFIDQHPPRRRE